jgi:putative PIN family toxin of toxin-antitoxin system
MRVMLDTNILISAGLFPNDRMDEIIDFIVRHHKLILPDLVIDEFLKVAAYDKFDRVQAAGAFLEQLTFSSFDTPEVTPVDGLTIRDDADYPILFSAVKANVDILITGDRDFLESDIASPRIMTLSEFASEFVD